MATRAVRVLVADADEAGVSALRALLRDAKVARFEVAAVAAIEDALIRIDARDADVVLVAPRLGGRDGLDLVREVRARGLPVPVLVFAGQDDFDADLQAAKAGASDYLVRGAVDTTRLERSIRYAISQKIGEESVREEGGRLAARVRDLEQQAQEHAFLGQLANLLQSALCEEEAYAVVAGYAQRLFPQGMGALFAANATRTRLDVVAAWGPGPAGERTFAPDACWALRNGQIHRVDADAPATRCPHAGAVDPTLVTLCVPLSSRDGVLGLLHLSAPASPARRVEEGPAPLTGPQHRLAVTLAEQVAVALTSLRLKDLLRRQSIRDALTGLFNRRYLEESMAREIFRAHRKGTPLGVAMMDLDLFKHFNDANGHMAGDLLLRSFGEYILSHIRGEDIACRFGGEEFALITPDATLESTMRRCEQIREGASRIVVDVGGRLLRGVTLSVGVASFPDHGTTLETLLRAADTALYAAKAAGRNCVVAASVQS
jgi:diguanylate cyclase (GGDEF)-like protein